MAGVARAADTMVSQAQKRERKRESAAAEAKAKQDRMRDSPPSESSSTTRLQGVRNNLSISVSTNTFELIVALVVAFPGVA